MRKTFVAINQGILRVERAIIATALSVMSVTVFLDVVHRRLSDPRSKVGDGLMWILGQTPESAPWIQGSLAPALNGAMVLFLLYLVAGGWSATRSRRLGLTVVGGLAAAGLSWLMAHQSSRVVYSVLVGGLGLGVCVHISHWQDGWRRLQVSAGCAFGLLGCGWGISVMPIGYSWAQNFSLFLLLWVGFLGASIATANHRHIQIDAVRKYVPQAWLAWYNALALLVAALFSCFLFWVAYLYTFGPHGNIHLTADLGRVPDWLVTASLPVAFTLMSVRFLAHVVDEVAAARAGQPSPMGRHEGGTH